MADTVVRTANRVKQWAAKFFTEYVRANRFKRYMGTDENAIIHMKEDLVKKKGDALTFSLVNALQGDGVEGSDTLDGAEEALDNDGHQISVYHLRNAVAITLEEEQSTQIDFLRAAKAQLKKWAMTKMRDHIITALMSINGNPYLLSQVNKNYATPAATENEKDAWLVANVDRVLFGAAKSNDSGPGDHSAALANVDASNDTLSAGILSLAKRMATTATPAIHPTTVLEDEEWFVMFASPLCFRDLKADTTIQQAQREAWMRGKDNPLFKGGDLIWDGIIIREVPEIPVISGVGAASIDVAPNFLCGVQAVGIAWAKRTTPISQDKDYKFTKGTGVMEMRGIEKLLFNDPDNEGTDVQHGVVTVYCAAVADT